MSYNFIEDGKTTKVIFPASALKIMDGDSDNAEETNVIVEMIITTENDPDFDYSSMTDYFRSIGYSQGYLQTLPDETTELGVNFNVKLTEVK